jgi:hypothetical protein
MLGIPAIGTRVVIGESGCVALNGSIGGAENGLTHVAEAVDHVPMVIVRDSVARLQARVGLDDSPLRNC